MANARLRQQLEFIVEIDKLKQVFRQNLLIDGSRRENDAEHSWHLAVMACILQEYVDEPVDLVRVLKMVLLHDLVEVDAGDAFCYDEAANLNKSAREAAAAKNLRFAAGGSAQNTSGYGGVRASNPEAVRGMLDRLQPMLHNYYIWARG